MLLKFLHDLITHAVISGEIDAVIRDDIIIHPGILHECLDFVLFIKEVVFRIAEGEEHQGRRDFLMIFPLV